MPEPPPAAVRFLAGLSKRLIVLIPASMVAGLLAGLAFDLSPLRTAVLPLTMLMVYPMLVNFRLTEAVSLKHGRALVLAMSLNFLVLPAIAWLLARAFFADQPGLYVGMILAGLFPTSGMTISWTGFAKGNVAAAVKMTVVGLLVASLAAPLYLWLLAGKVVAVDVWGVVQTVLLVVVVPLIAGTLTRVLAVRALGKQRFQSRLAPVFPGLSTLGVLAVVFVAIGLKAQMIVSQPRLLLTILVPLLLFYAANFLLATVAGRTFLKRGDAIACVYGTCMRNLSIALGVAIASFGPLAALVLALAYIVQVQSAAWYVRYSDVIFGARTEEVAAEGAPA